LIVTVFVALNTLFRLPLPTVRPVAGAVSLLPTVHVSTTGPVMAVVLFNAVSALANDVYDAASAGVVFPAPVTVTGICAFAVPNSARAAVNKPAFNQFHVRRGDGVDEFRQFMSWGFWLVFVVRVVKGHLVTARAERPTHSCAVAGELGKYAEQPARPALFARAGTFKEAIGCGRNGVIVCSSTKNRDWSRSNNKGLSGSNR
jgi:hypothetical protein